MTVLLRSLVVWLMLLALPYQGYASAQMLLCVAPAQAPARAVEMVMPSGPHDHAAMMAAAQAAHHDGDDGASAHHHTSMKCSGSACCAAAAPVLKLDLAAPALPLASRLQSYYSDFLPAVDLAHPERPPQSRTA